MEHDWMGSGELGVWLVAMSPGFSWCKRCGVLCVRSGSGVKLSSAVPAFLVPFYSQPLGQADVNSRCLGSWAEMKEVAGALSKAEARSSRCLVTLHPGSEPRGFRCDLGAGHEGSHRAAGREWT